MAVAIHGGLNRGVAQLGLDEFDVFTLGDEKRSVGVAQIKATLYKDCIAIPVNISPLQSPIAIPKVQPCASRLKRLLINLSTSSVGLMRIYPQRLAYLKIVFTIVEILLHVLADLVLISFDISARISFCAILVGGCRSRLQERPFYSLDDHLCPDNREDQSHHPGNDSQNAGPDKRDKSPAKDKKQKGDHAKHAENGHGYDGVEGSSARRKVERRRDGPRPGQDRHRQRRNGHAQGRVF